MRSQSLASQRDTRPGFTLRYDVSDTSTAASLSDDSHMRSPRVRRTTSPGFIQ